MIVCLKLANLKIYMVRDDLKAYEIIVIPCSDVCNILSKKWSLDEYFNCYTFPTKTYDRTK